MTHEDPHVRALAEHGGPEHDHTLPDAESVPVFSNVEDSLAPSMLNTDAGLSLPAAPGWWEETGDIADNPAHPLPGYGADRPWRPIWGDD